MDGGELMRFRVTVIGEARGGDVTKPVLSEVTGAEVVRVTSADSGVIVPCTTRVEEE